MKHSRSYGSVNSMVSDTAAYRQEIDRVRKSAMTAQYNMRKKASEAAKPIQEHEIETMVVIKSSFARSRTIVLGPRSELVLFFDKSGKSECPEHLLPILKQEMRARPGRYTIEVPVSAIEAPVEQPVAPVDIPEEAKLALEELMQKLLEEESAKVETPAKLDESLSQEDE